MFNLTIPLVYKRVYERIFFFFSVRANFVKMIKINEKFWTEEEMFVLIDIRYKREEEKMI